MIRWTGWDLQRKKSRQMEVSGKQQRKQGEGKNVRERKDEGRRGGSYKERKTKCEF